MSSRSSSRNLNCIVSDHSLSFSTICPKASEKGIGRVRWKQERKRKRERWIQERKREREYFVASWIRNEWLEVALPFSSLRENLLFVPFLYHGPSSAVASTQTRMELNINEFGQCCIGSYDRPSVGGPTKKLHETRSDFGMNFNHILDSAMDFLSFLCHGSMACIGSALKLSCSCIPEREFLLFHERVRKKRKERKKPVKIFLAYWWNSFTTLSF